MEEVAYCVNCGAKLPDDGQFCQKCGKLCEGKEAEEKTEKAKRDFPLGILVTMLIVAPGILIAIWMTCFASGGFAYICNGVQGAFDFENAFASFLMALLVSGALFDVGLVSSCLISYFGICFACSELSIEAELVELTREFPVAGLCKWGTVVYYLALFFSHSNSAAHGLYETYLPGHFSSNPGGAFVLESLLVWVAATVILEVVEWLFEVCARLCSR